jgi:hypothetical protein
VCDIGAYDTGGGIVPPLTLTGAIPLTAGVPARLGFAASNHGATFSGVAGVPSFNIGYITFQLGGSTFTVRQPVAIACSAPDHCVGTTGLVNGVPGFILVPPGSATLTLSGTISSGRGIFAQGAKATVTLSITASAAGVIAVGKVTVSVAGVNGGNPVATWATSFPAGTSIQINDAAPLIP